MFEPSDWLICFFFSKFQLVSCYLGPSIGAIVSIKIIYIILCINLVSFTDTTAVTQTTTPVSDFYNQTFNLDAYVDESLKKHNISEKKEVGLQNRYFCYLTEG